MASAALLDGSAPKITGSSMMTSLFRDRARARVRAGITLARGGATLGSIFMMHHRRCRGRCEINLRNGVSLIAPAEEPLLSLFEEVWVRRYYTPVPLELSREGTVVIDVGANVGVFAVWAASTFPRARIIAVEPSPRMCQFLRRNVRSNNIQNVEIIESACAGAGGQAMLYSRGIEALNSLYSHDNYRSSFRNLKVVDLITLDQLFDRFDVNSCALLKLDCEGAEYEILLNAHADTLRRVENIALEYHVGLNQYEPGVLSAFLSGQGFEVRCLPLMDEEGGYLYASQPRSKDS